MVNQFTAHGDALRLFFTEDIYLVNESVSEFSSLVKEPEVKLERTQTDFKFLGSNKRNILILVNDNDNDVSDEKGRELLRKIVKSVNLTASDFALLNYAKYTDTSFNQLRNYFSSSIIFAFGVQPHQLGLSSFPENQLVTEDGVKLIFSLGLTDLDKDPDMKKALWACLKQLGL